MTMHTIEACLECGDPAFTITDSELQDAEGWAECDRCGTCRNTDVFHSPVTQVEIRSPCWHNNNKGTEVGMSRPISDGVWRTRYYIPSTASLTRLESLFYRKGGLEVVHTILWPEYIYLVCERKEAEDG